MLLHFTFNTPNYVDDVIKLLSGMALSFV